MLIYSVTFCAIISTILFYCQTFPSALSCQKLHLCKKKEKRKRKKIIDQLVFCQIYQKFINKIRFIQITKFFEIIFSRYQCGFGKCIITQQRLPEMLQKRNRSIEKGKTFGALLTDLSKAFDCPDQKLLITKLKTYVFNIFSVDLFFIVSDIEIACFADDNTPYVGDKDRRSDTICRRGLKGLA